MLAAKHYLNFFAESALLPKNELLEIHRSKISLHRSKANYGYPTIRLPHKLSTLAGLPTRIFQTVHDGALAFLVVISKGVDTENGAEPLENAIKNAKSPTFTRRRSPVQIRPSPSFFLPRCVLSVLRAPWLRVSCTIIVWI